MGGVQVGGEDDTIEHRCPLCAARAAVDALAVRAGVRVIALVCEYVRVVHGTAALERVRANVLFTDGTASYGEGHSREESIVEALERAGRKP